MLFVTNFLACFTLIILAGRSVYSILLNISSIEAWEIERHEALLRRANKSGGYLSGPNGPFRLRRQEFPYDVGIWSNVVHGMGTSNVCEDLKIHMCIGPCSNMYS